MNKSEYHRYLASREWAVKKEQVKQRSAGTCERCQEARASEVHHVTYERLGHEDLDDLLHICCACHRFLSAKSDYDPLSHWKQVVTEIGQGYFFNYTDEDSMTWTYLTRLNYSVNAASYERRSDFEGDPRMNLMESLAESMIYYEREHQSNTHLGHAKDHIIEAMRDLRAFNSTKGEPQRGTD